MLKNTIAFHFKLSFVFLLLALFFGLLYSLQLLGYGADVFPPANARSLHISLVLYGFPPLMLSLLPFALFDKDNLIDKKGIHYLNLYFFLWYIFLIFMISSLMLGNLRGLPFYDFPYALNFILAPAGLFYLLSILRYIQHYPQKPLWVKVSLWVVVVAPFLLVLLMNPQYGQVEKMNLGPHGDNTLGMSFALFVLYYLVIKLHANIHFKPRFALLWIIPLGFYILSVLYRIVIGNLSYNQEWFFQWLTLLFIPALYFWFKDAKLSIKENVFLFIALLAFVFVDIEGNILYIPEMRHIFHRNDLVVGHSHIAVGISMLFLSFAVVKNYFSISNKMIITWALMITLMAGVLTLSGLHQANFISISTHSMWIARSFFGAMLLLLVVGFYLLQFLNKHYSTLEYYHMVGFLSDGLGGLLLLFFAQPLYHLLGFHFSLGYQTVIFGFMLSIGVMHLMGFINKTWQTPMALATALTRVVVSSLFFALYMSSHLDVVALGVSSYDLLYALIYLLFLHAI